MARIVEPDSTKFLVQWTHDCNSNSLHQMQNCHSPKKWRLCQCIFSEISRNFTVSYYSLYIVCYSKNLDRNSFRTLWTNSNNRTWFWICTKEFRKKWRQIKFTLRVTVVQTLHELRFETYDNQWKMAVYSTISFKHTIYY